MNIVEGTLRFGDHLTVGRIRALGTFVGCAIVAVGSDAISLRFTPDGRVAFEAISKESGNVRLTRFAEAAEEMIRVGRESREPAFWGLDPQSKIENPKSKIPPPLCRFGPGGDFTRDYTPGEGPGSENNPSAKDGTGQSEDHRATATEPQGVRLSG